MKIEQVTKVILEEEEKRMLLGTKKVLMTICGKLSCSECPFINIGEEGEGCAVELFPEVVKALNITEGGNSNE